MKREHITVRSMVLLVALAGLSLLACGSSDSEEAASAPAQAGGGAGGASGEGGGGGSPGASAGSGGAAGEAGAAGGAGSGGAAGASGGSGAAGAGGEATCEIISSECTGCMFGPAKDAYTACSLDPSCGTRKSEWEVCMCTAQKHDNAEWSTTCTAKFVMYSQQKAQDYLDALKQKCAAPCGL